MQAITITYKGPGNVRGSRLIAKCDAGQVTVPYEHGLDMHGNVVDATKALCKKLGWTRSAGYRGDWTVGQTHKGFYVAVYTGPDEPDRFCIE
ncbi:hypothetical protein VO98_020 [Pseudomonas phage phiPsa17]|uniref:Uncharacterized protein n=1 Tax=Pseudomonas phage phiPsa17 TaxID=1629654 RepID=A0A0G2T4I3_9CAUD|nr:hypothetical protein HOQ98_gp04 [Pseudomonas phage phiPsa17]AKG94346.1 hypothetical protein VO98_020 [Pseudomonas phage phiPsa17]QVD48991.1 hypothetical protein PCMW57_004 [Pseudomonas phage vB_Pci_PCMW57]URA07062.1 hypothetical protein Laurelin_BL5009 [Xanthomonas phage Laurelin]